MKTTKNSNRIFLRISHTVGLALLLLSSSAFAVDYYSRASGVDWNDNNTWSKVACGGAQTSTGTTDPNGIGDTATICAGHTITTDVTRTVGALTVNATGILNVATATTVSGATNISGTLAITDTSGAKTFTGQVTINNGGQWTNTVGEAVTFNGGLINNGNFNNGTVAATIRGGNLTNNGTFGGSVTMAGTTAQTIGGTAALTNLIINNTSTAGITLVNDVTVSTTLTLTDGAINTSGNTLITSFNCSNTNPSGNANSYIIGNLQLKFPSGTTTCTYPIGTGTSYAPMTIAMTTTALGSGTLTGSTIGNEHPEIAGSGIDSTQDANRYWTLWANGDTISASSYNATFTFVAGDLDVAATATSFSVGKYVGGTWTLPVPVTANATNTGVTGVAGPLNSPVAFAVGEAAFVCSVPASSPVGTTCVCDNFGRSNLNPSTIFGGNYTLTQSNGTAGWPKIATNGFLQLTDSSTNMSTSITLPGTFPAAGNMITVEFKHYAYGGTGADGVALTLSDASVAPVPGAYGGSLGFAQKTLAGTGSVPGPADINGFTGGWVGVGLDEFGNFSNPTEGRIGGPGFRPDAVAIRGSGSALLGYPYLGGTATLATGIDNTAAPRAPGYTYRITVDARCYQRNTNIPGLNCNNPTLIKTTAIAVDRDTGAGYTSLVSLANAYALNGAQADVPTNWKLSFSSSTGNNTNIHELTGLKVCAQTITPPAGYRIQIDNLTPSTCGTPGGSPSSPIVTITALDTNGNTVTTYNQTVTLSTTLTTGGATTATWRKVGAGANLPGNQYTFVPADNGVAQFYLTDANPQSVIVSVTENGGALSSTSNTPIVYSGGSFTIANNDALGDGVVAGRPHQFRITRTNGCAPNTAYTGVHNLDGWYTPAIGDHPTGANAPQICATNGSGSCLPSTGACQTLSIAAPVADVNTNNIPALTFASGVSNFCLVTSDVGKYSISLRDDVTAPATPVSGSYGALTARPFAVAVSDVKQAAVNNPAVNTPDGTVFAKAGSNFQATVGGYLWKSTGASIFGVGDSDGNGLPDAAAISSVLSNGIASHYADTVTLGAGIPFFPATASEALGATGVAGAVNGAVTLTNGSTTQLSLSYSEVGTFSMKATPATNYLNSSINLANRVLIFSNPASSAQNALVGRFIPDHFSLSGGSISNRADLPACAASAAPSTFTYMGEPMNALFTLTAKALGTLGNTTQNYTGAYAKLATTPASAFSFGAIAGNTTPLTARLDDTMATTGSFSGGVATMTVPIVVRRNVVSTVITTDGDYGITNPANAVRVGIHPQDVDSVTLVPADLNLDTDLNSVVDSALLGITKVAFGRLKLSNAAGSELLALPVPVEANYWNGTFFVTNVLDSCTPLTGTSVTMDAYKKNLNACETTVPATVMLVNGKARFILSKPGVNNNGSVDLTVNLGTPAGNTCLSPAPEIPATSANELYLQGNWTSSAYTDNPKARATFGLYKSGPVIYIREMY